MAEGYDVAEMATEVVSAYVRNNHVPAVELPDLIRQVHAALTALTTASAVTSPAAPTPAVPIKKSVTPDYIVCLEDGRRMKSLKRHLKARYDLTPEQYRAKWGLPASYPMVAPGYTELRSNLARKMGLGQVRRNGATGEAQAQESPPILENAD